MFRYCKPLPDFVVYDGQQWFEQLPIQSRVSVPEGHNKCSSSSRRWRRRKWSRRTAARCDEERWNVAADRDQEERSQRTYVRCQRRRRWRNGGRLLHVFGGVKIAQLVTFVVVVCLQVVLLNGNWDTSYKIPNIIAEMHHVNIDDLQAYKAEHQFLEQHDFEGRRRSSSSGCSANKQIKIEMNNSTTLMNNVPSPIGSDSGIEMDCCSDGNLSWLLNYKINELPPVPGEKRDQQQQHQTMPTIKILGGLPEIKISEQQFGDGQKMLYQEPKLPSSSSQTTYRYSGPKKPPFTYTELIEHALVEKGELTVSGIYQWISDHFPFYKQNDDRWKNSVRHNLSINPHFRKGSKAVHGAGHLWTIAQREDQKTWNIVSFSHFTTAKTLRILTFESICNWSRRSSGCNSEIIHHQRRMQQPQNVEVEYVIDMSGGLGGSMCFSFCPFFCPFKDFLCPPVSKEQVAEECGLGNDYLITDLNPAALGLNLSEAEMINGANIYDDLNFQCYELQTE
ncbi:PREDICTED: uncharacterized protein LOC108556500 [Nicrophorus vespilloides]|uniref:Uncharacterized protein LOC108556500 n=1 Tax=Nicrophorus vespilloides TaxID=110193 RepID=A0ABM1M0M4_NICVS|nr:PREDICTED: uncharacterized protein LOC108556500 [Nicrophorus vespilloides]